ncbi:hypothetical protein COT97_00730 [Candidatus Falkowbacteria bacterium CG10_big_fil_rev_8_21_14_0_10_39_11]|uniref:Cell division protein FtsX n=1 Tax=Candidatus Falkowbacteria bacterium CG10_big_fil_rev_8_21_14_0_10_39_11 TaxID=1974565 RepID=A0A2H0V662_9BACT|nr:MAG: hypothetical protein COT97_00730 [Candidatus Falkowbacteria bacterium CG10_big_fil_rev_8_21_14_0_10_39_11]
MLTFLRVLKFALQDFWRNFWLTLVTVSVLVLALFSVNILITLKAVSDNIIDSVHDKVDINIMLVSEATEVDVNNFKTFVSNTSEVDTVSFLSKEMVLEQFKQKNIGNPDIQSAISELEDNPFNDTLVVKAGDPSDYDLILQKIQASEYSSLVDNNDFSDPQKIISFVQSVSDKVEKFGIFIAVLFSLIAFLIVFNTIRVTIYTHKEEIGVMRLVGATNWFIRMPFILESVLYAFVALLINIGLIYLFINILTPYLGTFLANYDFDLTAYFSDRFLLIFGLEFVLAVVLTILSSAFAIRRYLKV